MQRTSAIVAIAKDENPYILEWLAYHIAIGVDHIFLYDNGSRVPLDTTLSASWSWRRITVIRWEDKPGTNAQLEAYAHFMRTYGHAFEWVAAIDADEFISLPQHDRINTFLAGFPHACGIAINWRYFGSSGQDKYEPGLVIERFTQASHINCGPNTGIKAIYRTVDVETLRHHYSITRGPRKLCSADGTPVQHEIPTVLAIAESNFKIAQINHYFCKSKEEWLQKIRRGYSWVMEDRSTHFVMTDLNDVEERTILRWKDQTKHVMKRIGARRGIQGGIDTAAKPLIEFARKVTIAISRRRRVKSR